MMPDVTHQLLSTHLNSFPTGKFLWIISCHNVMTTCKITLSAGTSHDIVRDNNAVFLI